MVSAVVLTVLRAVVATGFVLDDPLAGRLFTAGSRRGCGGRRTGSCGRSRCCRASGSTGGWRLGHLSAFRRWTTLTDRTALAGGAAIDRRCRRTGSRRGIRSCTGSSTGLRQVGSLLWRGHADCSIIADYQLLPHVDQILIGNLVALGQGIDKGQIVT